MRKRFYISRRRRVLWTGVALFCLLFQQLAMAAYICTLPSASTDIGMMGHCTSMGMGSAPSATHQHGMDPLCAQHCASVTASTHDASVPLVPPLLLTAASPAMLGTIATPVDHPALPNPALRRSDPPPTLRFCSLLI